MFHSSQHLHIKLLVIFIIKQQIKQPQQQQQQQQQQQMSYQKMYCTICNVWIWLGFGEFTIEAGLPLGLSVT